MSPTLGQLLRHARETRELSLQDAAHFTRIPLGHLRELEEDNYTVFGGMAYTRSFVKKYADFLQVDAHEYLEKFEPPPLAGPRDYMYLLRSLGPWLRERRTTPYTSASGSGGDANLSQNRPFVVITAICGAVLLLGIGVLLGNVFFGNQTAENPTASEVMSSVERRERTLEAHTASAMDLPSSSHKSWSAPADTEAESIQPTQNTATDATTAPPKAIPVTSEGESDFVPPMAIPVEDDPPETVQKARRK